jgi:hypothetical protein
MKFMKPVAKNVGRKSRSGMPSEPVLQVRLIIETPKGQPQ